MEPFYIVIALLAIILVLGIKLQARSNQHAQPEVAGGEQKTGWPTLFENLQLIVVNTDTAGRIKYINRYGAVLLGYDAIELINSDWNTHYLCGKDAGIDNAEKDHFQINGKPVSVKKKVMITKEGKEKIIAGGSVSLC